jgi:hypothetical protein
VTFNELAAWVEKSAPQLRFDPRNAPMIFEADAGGDAAVPVVGAAAGDGEIRLYA